MNKFIVPFLILPFFGICQSVDSLKKPLTKFEQFTSETGSLRELKKEKLGRIKEATLYKETLTDIESGKAINSVYIEFKSSGFLTPRMTTGAIIFDPEEIQGLISSLKYIQANVLGNKCKEDCPSYTYASRGGVEMIASKFEGAYASNWHIYFSRYGSLSLGGEVGTDHLDDFIKMLETYK